MKKILLLLSLFLVFSCSTNKENLTKVVVTTNKGNISFVLLNETPLHRDNFVKMAKDGFYDSIQFHRVIEKFVIQTGNQNSKNLHADSVLIDGGAEHLIEAEIVEGFNHFRGAVGAARTGDDENPERKSSGSHFYIVQGKNNQNLTDSLFTASGITDALVKENYTKNGGTPHLDGAYTIFGYVIDGMDVVDDIAKVKTSTADRPLTNIIIEKIQVSEINETELKDNENHKLFRNTKINHDK